MSVRMRNREWRSVSQSIVQHVFARKFRLIQQGGMLIVDAWWGPRRTDTERASPSSRRCSARVGHAVLASGAPARCTVLRRAASAPIANEDEMRCSETITVHTDIAEQ